jgi:hypothetical protein
MLQYNRNRNQHQYETKTLYCFVIYARHLLFLEQSNLGYAIHRTVVQKPFGKRIFERPENKLEDKMDCREAGCGDGQWNEVVQNRVQDWLGGPARERWELFYNM